jgi:quinol monooxygenase YgiN
VVKVISRYTVNPDKLREFQAVSARLIAICKKKKGCLDFELYQDVQNLNTFVFIEEWHDGETLALHMQSKHLNTILPIINELKVGKSDGIVCRLVK